MTRVAAWSGRWGSVDSFGLPVTRRDAKAWLERFVTERLGEFGPYEDALVQGEHELLHSALSSIINVGLLHPLEVVQRAERAYRDGDVPIASAEGFIRQILGWREFMRGMYWQLMPGLRTANALDAPHPLPRWFWAPDGEQYGGSTRYALRDALPRRFHPAGARSRAHAPHQPPHGAGQLRHAARRGAGGALALVLGRLHRRVRVGGAAQRRRHGHVR